MKVKIVKAKLGSSVMQKALADPSISIIVTNFHGVDWHNICKVFPAFVIFNRPGDFRAYSFVCRVFDGTKPLRLMTVADTLEGIRLTIPKGFLRVPAGKNDDHTIIETWI